MFMYSKELVALVTAYSISAEKNPVSDCICRRENRTMQLSTCQINHVHTETYVYPTLRHTQSSNHSQVIKVRDYYFNGCLFRPHPCQVGAVTPMSKTLCYSLKSSTKCYKCKYKGAKSKFKNSSEFNKGHIVMDTGTTGSGNLQNFPCCWEFLVFSGQYRLQVVRVPNNSKLLIKGWPRLIDAHRPMLSVPTIELL